MRKIIDIEQRSPEWLQWRKGKIGCSDLSAIMGVNPRKTSLQLWEDKVSEKSTPVNAAMQRGIDYEDEAREAICLKLGSPFKPICMEHSRKPYIIASLDGWCESGGVIEIKVPSKDKHLMALGKIVPEEYMPQLQGIMLVANEKDIWYVSYDPETKQCADVFVKRDDYICEEIERACDEFYRRLIEMDPPEPEEKDYQQCLDCYGYAKEMRSVLSQKKEIEKKEKELRHLIIEQIGEKNAIMGDLRITRSVRPGNVNYELIPELVGVNLDVYRKKPITSYRFT